ncbi:MAG: ACP S-malonyltransferase [Desulfobacterota bacterium]|nr:ACP S-malonyltransferase [Thermodesulfobacteriota bacterium]
MIRWAFLFPGQGSQYVGMGKDLKENFAIAAETFAEADEALHEHLSKLCFEGPEADLKLTKNTQPAILTVSIAALRVLQKETGITPIVAAGHSLGEYSALVCAGALAFSDAVRIVRLRGTFMQEAVPVGVGGMAAILGLDTPLVEQACREAAQGEHVAPANYNCPGQIVISGHIEAVKRAAAKAEVLGAKKTVMLPVSAPFHSVLMQPAAERLGEALQPIPVADLLVPVLSNVEADFYPSKDAVKPLLTRQVSSPVRWIEEMEKLLQQQPDRALEIGPGNVLCGLMRKINKDMKIQKVDTVDDIKEVIASIKA